MAKKTTDSFEANLGRLTEIVEQVEDSQTPLETAISLYKEGLTIAEKCGDVLRRCEEEILTLQKTVDAFSLEPFAAEQV